MAKPTAYTATHKGETFTRKSHRTYTHAVVAPNGNGTHYCAGWCGRLDLANALAGRTPGGIVVPAETVL